MRWAEIPLGWVRAYAAMLPRLRDEEMLREIIAGSAGNGMMQADARRELIRKLQPVRAASRTSSLDEIRALGVKVTEV